MKFRERATEVMPLACIAVLIIVILISFNLKGADELADPEMSIEVTGAWHGLGPVDGQLPVEGKEWLILDVNVTNRNEAEAILVSIPHFHAVTDRMERIWVFNSEDYDHGSIEPGENQTLRLIFDVMEGDNITGLEYAQRVSGPVSCDVPPPDPYPVSDPERAGFISA